MKKYILAFTVLIICLTPHLVSAADYDTAHSKTLQVKTMKQSIPIQFYDTMTIEQIKKKIQKQEGVLVAHQVLIKKEWVRKGFILPTKNVNHTRRQ